MGNSFEKPKRATVHAIEHVTQAVRLQVAYNPADPSIQPRARRNVPKQASTLFKTRNPSGVLADDNGNGMAPESLPLAEDSMAPAPAPQESSLLRGRRWWPSMRKAVTDTGLASRRRGPLHTNSSNQHDSRRISAPVADGRLIPHGANGHGAHGHPPAPQQPYVYRVSAADGGAAATAGSNRLRRGSYISIHGEGSTAGAIQYLNGAFARDSGTNQVYTSPPQHEASPWRPGHAGGASSGFHDHGGRSSRVSPLGLKQASHDPVVPVGYERQTMIEALGALSAVNIGGRAAGH